MKFWVALIGILAIFLIFPYIRCFNRRLVCKKKIEKLCKKKDYRIHTTHPLWFLGNKHSKINDLYIETINEVFAIKLFGVPNHLSVLVIKDNGEYYIRRYLGLLSYGSASRLSVNGKPRPMPVYNFRYKYKDEWEIKTPRHILLVNPVSMEFRRQPSYGSEIIVDAGDIVNGMEIDSLPRLLGDLESAL